jgi:[acyl-carrier-protein] S-malonyltransferase
VILMTESMTNSVTNSVTNPASGLRSPKKRIVVVFPGRGSYGKEELGYLKKSRERLASHPDALLAATDRERLIEEHRQTQDKLSLQAMDQAAKFLASTHTVGHNASILIYACALNDFLAINRDRFEIVATCGNSLGWYLTLSAAGALSENNAIKIVESMGSMMADGVVGGQLIYPLIDDDWRVDPKKVQLVENLLLEVNASGRGRLFVSIRLGGYVVLGGDEDAVSYALRALPPSMEHYPMKLVNHAAFHTPVLEEVSHRAKQVLPLSMFQAPKIPMIDGRGHIWRPYSCDVSKLYDYTLGHQVHKTYDFTMSIEVALKEFAPDCLVLVGPGSGLGGSIGQTMIQNKWLGIESKADFLLRQKDNPVLISMGREDQTQLVL